MSSVFEILRSHCEEHQESVGDDRSLSVERRAIKVVKEIQEHCLASQMQRVGLCSSEGEASFEKDIAQQLIDFVECSLYSLLETDNESKDAVRAVLELLAAVSVSDALVCAPVVERAVQLSDAKLDSIRAAVCQFIGCVVGKIMSLPKKRIPSFNNVLDQASQMLIPRMTDKSQSVRLAAIQSSVHFFSDDATDPDILQSLLWCMQHDTSVANRVAATECVPINLETIDYVIQRIRDTKSKVRVAALQAIRNKCKDLSLLDPAQCASLVQTGFTERCQETKFATEKVVFLSWMKLAEYNPVQLLKHLSVIDHEKECETVASILFGVDKSDDLLSSLSDAETRALRDGIKNSVVSLVDITKEESLSVENLFLSVSACKFASSHKDKDAVLEKILPDISILCQGLEKLTGDLIQAIETDDIESQDRLVFMCEQLMKLAVLSDLEEGSRRLFVTALSRLLTSMITPDDLITEVVKTLHFVSLDESQFLNHTMSVIRQIDQFSKNQDGLEINCKLRIVSVLSSFFEVVGPNDNLTDSLYELSNFIVPATSEPNKLLREAAMNCLGKFGLFSSAEQIETIYLSMLTKVCKDVSEAEEVRAQALLCLADWSFLHGISSDFALIISDFLERGEHPKSLIYVAAEIATRLLLIGKTDSSAWLGALLATFFDPQTEKDFDDFDDVTQVGNPIRVHQILTIFFPAYCSMHHHRGLFLLESVGLALEQIQSRRDQRKKASKRGTSRKVSRDVFPYAKMLDYVVNIMEDASSKAGNSQQEGPDKDDNDESQSQPLVALRAACQVAAYLETNLCDLNVTLIRTLCKWLGSQDIDASSNDTRSLSRLKTCLDGIEMALSDSTAERYLARLAELLSEVTEDCSQSEPDEDSDVDTESDNLAESFYKLQVSSESPLPKENVLKHASLSLSSKSQSRDSLSTPNRRLSLGERHVNVE